MVWTSPIRACYRQALVRALNATAFRPSSSGCRSSGYIPCLFLSFIFSLAFLCRLTRKRVEQLLHYQLLVVLVLCKLVPYVLFYRSPVPPNSVHVIPSAQELPVAVPVLKIRKPVEYHQAALPLQIPHHAGHAVFRRYRQQHVDMVRTRLRLQYLYPLAYAQLPQYLSYLYSYLSVYCLSAILRRKHYVGTYNSIWYELNSHYPFSPPHLGASWQSHLR